MQGRYSGVCARRIDVVRGGAPKFEIDVCCLLYTSQLVSNVINLDFSFRTRILSPSNSSGVLRYESETVLVLFQEPRFKSFLRPFQKAQFEVHLTAPVWVSSLSAGDFQAFIDFQWLCIVHKARAGCCSFSSASKVVKSSENACKK